MHAGLMYMERRGVLARGEEANERISFVLSVEVLDRTGRDKGRKKEREKERKTTTCLPSLPP